MPVDPTKPEGHREVLIVPFQDHVDHGILHNGFGIEIVGADFANYRAGLYRAFLRTSNRVVVQIPTARSSLMRHYDNYVEQRRRLGGHSETYEVARMVVRNRIMARPIRQHYNLELVFPEEYELTNAVFSPGTAPLGRIEPQVTPVLIPCQVSSQRTVVGIECDLCFAITIVEEEPRVATTAVDHNADADALDAALEGMTFGNDDE